LILLVLVPLTIDLQIKSFSPKAADHRQRMRDKIIALAMLILRMSDLGLNLSTEKKYFPLENDYWRM
jgi:hypothetical protein